MAELIRLPTFVDARGSLTVLEKCLPFAIQRVYWIYDLSGEPRGGHRHLETTQAMICLQGRSKVDIKYSGETHSYILESPQQCLILDPQDWHQMRELTPQTILLVLASHPFDKNDYRTDPL